MKRMLIIAAVLWAGAAAAQKTPDTSLSHKERAAQSRQQQAGQNAEVMREARQQQSQRQSGQNAEVMREARQQQSQSRQQQAGQSAEAIWDARQGTEAPQEVRVPEETDILAKTLSPDSPYFYPRMMMRYMEGDETLTPEHYYYLYYGHAYDASYDAHKALPGAAVMAAALGRTGPGGVPSHEEALEIIAAGRQNMMIDPFSPSNLNLMTWAYGLVGDSVNMQRSAERFAGVVGAIVSSGTGAREKSPWHILRFEHAADIVAAQGLEAEKSTVRTRDVEYVQVARNSHGVKGFFFDFSRVYLKPHEGKRVEREHRWEFNGTPV